MKIFKKISIIVIVLLLLTVVSIPAFAMDGEDSIPRYGASTISSNEKYVYMQLVEGILCESPKAEITLDPTMGVTVEEMMKGINVFLSDYPECFWMTNEYSYACLDSAVHSITPNYAFIGADLPHARIMLENTVNEILSGMTATSDYDKALWLHDALAERVTYEQVGHHQTAYGALVDQKAVCAGYAAAYQLLLNRAGIIAWTVTGSSYDPQTDELIGQHYLLLNTLIVL